jgi:hypothetical protein
MFARRKNTAVHPLLKIIQAYRTSIAKILCSFIDLDDRKSQADNSSRLFFSGYLSSFYIMRMVILAKENIEPIFQTTPTQAY